MRAVTIADLWCYNSRMDRETLQALDKSDITVKEFVSPTGIYSIAFTVIVAAFVAYSRRSWFERGRIVEQILGSDFARFSYIVQPLVFYGMLVLHSGELAYFIRNQLRRHSVNVRTFVWWQWVFFCFIEGQFAFKRFNDLVRRKREEREKLKH